jgi:hypothetical protein
MPKSKPRAAPSHKRSALVVSLALDGLAIALFVTLVVVLVSSDREAARDGGVQGARTALHLFHT